MKYVSSYLLLLFYVSTAFAQTTPHKIVILGDSLTDGYGVDRSSAYPNLLELRLKEKYPNWSVINAGSSGSTSASAVSRLQWHLKSKPDILILALGANDGLRGFPAQSTHEQLQKAIALAQNHSIRVVLAGMKLPINYGEKYRSEFEKVFVQLSHENKLPLIPFLLEGVGGESNLNQADGIHPNELGHKRIVDNIYPVIEPLVKELNK